ncbi:leucine--tRNA ligase, partial [bacterium F16]
LRLYEMFMGPLDATKPWNTESVPGVYRFLQRVWRLFVDEDGSLSAKITDTPLSKDLRRVLHQTIKKVGSDVNSLNFNTAISQMMIFVNEFSKAAELNRDAMVDFLKLVSPFAPHLGEEIWQMMGHSDSIAYAPWPDHNEDFLKLDEVEILVQFKGKPKARITMSPNLKPDEMEAVALAHPDVQAELGDQQIIKVICVPGRLVNIVCR